MLLVTEENQERTSIIIAYTRAEILNTFQNSGKESDSMITNLEETREINVQK
jgi:hypothetical protein